MLDALRGDGTRDPRLQSALNETALMMQYGGLQDKAALEAKATARALTVSDQERVRSQEVEDRDLGYANALALKKAERGADIANLFWKQVQPLFLASLSWFCLPDMRTLCFN
jgi:hypothetical protein